jgi:hypothetical protein
MKFKVGALALAVLLAAGVSFTSFAGSLADADGDLVPDGFDNCSAKANTDQLDSNQDGYGNVCDADFDNNGTVGQTDFTILGQSFGTALGQPGYNADVDCDGTDSIGQPDFTCLGVQFGGPPGPSGLSCAGTITCP